MEDGVTETTTGTHSFIGRHSFLLFITISIFISAVVVFISLQMYNISGTAQLDLSRPGYVSIRSQIDNSDGDFQTFSSSGTINKKVIGDFNSLFNKQAKKIKAIDAFSGSPLDIKSLGISDTSQQ